MIQELLESEQTWSCSSLTSDISALDPHATLQLRVQPSPRQPLSCTEEPSVSTVRPHKDRTVIDTAARTVATGTDARRHRWLGALRVTKETQRRHYGDGLHLKASQSCLSLRKSEPNDGY